MCIHTICYLIFCPSKFVYNCNLVGENIISLSRKCDSREDREVNAFLNKHS